VNTIVPALRDFTSRIRWRLRSADTMRARLYVGVEEMVGKIKALVDTRRDADMVIIARNRRPAIEAFRRRSIA
jgi:hypothetical protein